MPRYRCRAWIVLTAARQFRCQVSSRSTFIRKSRSMIRLTFMVILVASFRLARSIVAQEPAREEQAVLTPGDSVRIQVWRSPDSSGDFVVGPDGLRSYPL